MVDDNNLHNFNKAARRAAAAAQEKSDQQRRGDNAKRARARIAVLRTITAGELATQEDLQLQRYKG